MKEEKRKMRHILRAQMIWSRGEKVQGLPASYGYTKGLLRVIQRLLNIATEEEAFWLLNGIVRSIPRLFATNQSCLEGGRQSIMRNEMTIFKAILRENLPSVCDKLKLLGVSVEFLVYEPITSLYANYFASDVVLRLWDQIIFHMTTQDKDEKKRGIWFILAPAYLIFLEKKGEIENAKTAGDIIGIY